MSVKATVPPDRVWVALFSELKVGFVRTTQPRLPVAELRLQRALSRGWQRTPRALFGLRCRAGPVSPQGQPV